LVKTNTDQKPLRIGIARDHAFGFYYSDDIKALENAGATICDINMFTDKCLPELDGLFIGGGFPESHLDTLSQNSSLMRDISTRIDNGLPVYAECGGLMYLTRSIQWGNKSHLMVGAIPADTLMCDRPQGRGYVRVKETEHMPWPQDSSRQSKEYCAHEFHYSKLINVDPNIKFAYKMLRGYGINGQYDGIIYKNVVASYTHLKNVKHNRWAERFIKHVRNIKLSEQVRPDSSRKLFL